MSRLDLLKMSRPPIQVLHLLKNLMAQAPVGDRLLKSADGDEIEDTSE